MLLLTGFFEGIWVSVTKTVDLKGGIVWSAEKSKKP